MVFFHLIKKEWSKKKLIVSRRITEAVTKNFLLFIAMPGWYMICFMF